MRRFSQRNSLVTLSDINITPLLDLAFVLLIIFIIITPSIQSREQPGMDLKLPQGGGQTRKVDPKDIRRVEISPRGDFMLDGIAMAPDEIERELVKTLRSNPNLVVRIRADENGLNKHLYQIFDGCYRNDIPMSLDTEEPRRRK